MKRTFIRNLIAAAAAVMLLSAFTAYADEDPKNYDIEEAYWNADSFSGAIAEWDEAESKTSYKVHLYKGSKSIGEWKSASGTRHNFTSDIISHGTGEYYFLVYSVKGGKDNTMTASDTLVVGNGSNADISMDMLKNAKSNTSQGAVAVIPQSSAGQSVPGAGPGVGPGSGNSYWQQNGDGSWSYLVNGQYVVNNWYQVNGLWYYFDANGRMMTGWTWIRSNDGVSRCYYLEPQANSIMPQGACYMNRITPDGYSVDGSGAWVVNGVVQTR